MKPVSALAGSELEKKLPSTPNPMRAGKSFNSYPVLGIAVGAFLTLILALFAAKQGKLLQLVIPLGFCSFALLLLRSRPGAYLKLSLWTWFLMPLVRRLVDDRCGFSDQSLILATPMLVSAMTIFDIWPFRRTAVRPEQLVPFFLCFGGVLFGVSINLLLEPSVRVAYVGMQWFVPVLFGFYLCCHEDRSELYQRVISFTLLHALPLLTLYGLFQFIVMPPWDVYWLNNVMDASGANTFGRAEPGMLRVWSTVNAPGTFALMLVAGMILLSFKPSRLKIPILLLAIVNLGLSLVRTAWIALAVALVCLAFAVKLKTLYKGLAVLVVLLCFAPLLAFIPRVSDAMGERLATFNNPTQDVSYQDRREVYQEAIGEIVKSPFGNGHMSQLPIDSGILEMLLSLGWPGTLAYLAGPVLILGSPFVYRRRTGTFIRSCYAAAVALISVLFSGNSLIDLPGILLWICLGLYWSGENASI